MLSLRHLKVITIFFVSESELSPLAKRQLYNFITDDASEAQLKALISTGKICSESEAKEIALREEPVITTVAVLIASAAAVGKVAYHTVFSKASKECASVPALERPECLIMYKKRALERKMNEFDRVGSRCSQTSDPERCRTMFIKAKKKISNKILRLKRK